MTRTAARCHHCAEIERSQSFAVCPVHQPALYARLVSPQDDRQAVAS